MLWYLRTGLEGAVERHREMVERRVERVREKERSVLYKHKHKLAGGISSGGGRVDVIPEGQQQQQQEEEEGIENQLSAEQLQLFEDENQSMLRYYEDTLSKVRYVVVVGVLVCPGCMGE